MSITADVDYTNFSRYLREASRSASPEMKRRYFKNAGALILRMEAGIFQTDGANLGTRWKPLSAATIAMRKSRRNLKGKRASGMQVLRDTGALRMSVTGGSAERGPTGSIREIRPLELLIGTRLKYAPTHQYGRPAMTIPNVKVRAHTRKWATAWATGLRVSKSGKATIGPSKHGATLFAFSRVREHTRTQYWGPVPARPFVGWTNWGIEAVVMEAYRHFIEGPDQRTK